MVGGLAWIGLRGVGMAPNPDYAATIPHQAYMIYQCMFAVITPALITGAVAERMKFKTYLVFMLLWSTLVYDVVAHWVWGTGGWLRNMGALDFAGGTVVHVSSGVSALVAALMIGRRRGYPDTPMPPHNLPYTLLGTGLLWFGWFGFNAGSAVTAGTASTGAFIATHVAAASAALGWVVMDWLVRGRPTALGAASGAVAGLVAITPASGYVGPLSAIVIGAAAGCVCFLAVILRAKTTVDDSLDVFGVHGTGGTLGALMTGLFAQKAINAAGADGLFFGNAVALRHPGGRGAGDLGLRRSGHLRAAQGPRPDDGAAGECGAGRRRPRRRGARRERLRARLDDGIDASAGLVRHEQLARAARAVYPSVSHATMRRRRHPSSMPFSHAIDVIIVFPF